MSISPGWYVTKGFFVNGGHSVAGPFADREDAFTARVGIESVDPNGMTYCIDEVHPKPAVQLPETPTLGWLSGEQWSGRLGVWQHSTGSIWIEPIDSSGDNTETLVEGIKAFVEATAVPTSALDKLRADFESSFDLSPSLKNDARRDAINAFLAAIDGANS